MAAAVRDRLWMGLWDPAEELQPPGVDTRGLAPLAGSGLRSHRARASGVDQQAVRGDLEETLSSALSGGPKHMSVFQVQPWGLQEPGTPPKELMC